MIKRLFDIIFSLSGILTLSPLFIIIALLIVFDSKGSVFYLQKRVGKDNKDFYLIKFRTMKTHSDKNGLLTIGNKDSRITRSGYFLRKFKLDEFPQLFNVLFGNMSIVGPRPEVRKYVNMYNDEQKRVLKVKPGITDYASIEYINENEILQKATDPENTYIHQVMPHKLSLNLKYIKKTGVLTDLRIIFYTIKKIIMKSL